MILEIYCIVMQYNKRHVFWMTILFLIESIRLHNILEITYFKEQSRDIFSKTNFITTFSYYIQETKIYLRSKLL